jgi:RNA polymerase sigma factor (sigma-70 family)
MGTQFAKICGGYEDAVQIAMIGLIRASEKFDLDKNIKFSTYASYSILGKLSHQEVNKGQIMNNVLCMSMNRPVRASNTKTRDSDTEELAEFIGKVIEPRYKEQTKFEYNPQEEVEKSDSIRFIEKIINDRKCDSHEKVIVKEYIGITESKDIPGVVTLKLLGQKHGVSRERIRQILEEFYAYIKRQLLKVPDYKLAIEGRVKKENARNNVRYSRPSSESIRYKRIMDEGVKDVRVKRRRKENLKHYMVISGFCNFYCDRYQDMMRVLTRKAEIAKRTNSNVAYTLSLQAALQRRKAQITQTDSVSAVVTTKAPDVTFTVQSAPPEKEPPKDQETAEMLQYAAVDSEEAFRLIEDTIVEQSEISEKGFGIGSLEDDGDLDYEVESA